MEVCLCFHGGLAQYELTIFLEFYHVPFQLTLYVDLLVYLCMHLNLFNKLDIVQLKSLWNFALALPKWVPSSLYIDGGGKKELLGLRDKECGKIHFPWYVEAPDILTYGRDF